MDETATESVEAMLEALDSLRRAYNEGASTIGIDFLNGVDQAKSASPEIAALRHRVMPLAEKSFQDDCQLSSADRPPNWLSRAGLWVTTADRADAEGLCPMRRFNEIAKNPDKGEKAALNYLVMRIQTQRMAEALAKV